MHRATLTVLLLAAAMPANAACPGYTLCPAINYPAALAHSPAARAVSAGIAATEAATLQAMGANDISFGQLMSLLGQAMAFDTTLSATRMQACAECHFPQAGFAGGIPAFARTGGIFPGANPNRTGFRTPQSLAYAAFAPVLTYNPASATFAGGNFWDSRATGEVTGNAASDQAAVPLTNPFEMALPDPACAIRRISLAPYAAIFGKIWGTEALAIAWPKNTDEVCARLNNGAADQAPLHLAARDRAQAVTTVKQIGVTIGAWEQSTLASPFHSKFDAVHAGTASFTKLEQAGDRLFTGRAHCAACHAVSLPNILFTNFISANIGVPRNPANPYLGENAPASDGYVANPAGPAFIDEGLGGFLASAADTNPQWQAQAARFMGAFQVPTLRNTAAAPGVKSYMHNGYFTSLRSVVHFLNTRDVLPTCTGTTGIGVSCWPAPEQPANVDHTLTGNLGLSAYDEAALVAFMGTLSDE